MRSQLQTTQNFLKCSAWLLLSVVVCGVPFSSASSPRPSISDVPSWAKQAVWYQIFPERFHNGDRANDPTVEDIHGSWPHEQPKAWSVSSWTGDWYKLQPWEEASGKGFYYCAQLRRYGGDLQGVIDKLDYLNDLGVNALYFNPLFESPSLHKYDATMYHHIDNNFGPDPAGDRKTWNSEDPSDPATWQWTAADRLFLKLISEAHKRGMKVIIDGVFNHVGSTFWAIVDAHKNGEKSQYKDWFSIKSFDNPATPEDEFAYIGWNDVKELPEVHEDANGFVHGPREHIHAIVKRWMDPNGDGDPSDGVDGWRLDVAEKVALPFWKEFRTWVRGINPQAYIVGEVWWEDWKNDKIFNAAPWLQGDVFDAVMNYRWAREVDHFFRDDRFKTSPSEFLRRLEGLRSDYRSEANYALMNLVDSHDTDRLASQVVNVDSKYDHNVGLADNPDYKVRKPNADEVRTQKLIVLFQMSYLGAPMIYYGDEAGMWGADDPDDRKPMLWADMTYDDESHHPFGKLRPDDKNEFNRDLFDYYKRLIAVRRSQDALSLGDVSTLLTDDERDVLALSRSYRDQHVVIIINNSSLAQKVSLQMKGKLSGLHWVDLLGVSGEIQMSESLGVTLGPKSGMLLEARHQ